VNCCLVGVSVILAVGVSAGVARGAVTRTPGECQASAPGPGVVDPFHVPSDAAKQLNADALAFYRQGRWDEARTKYQAALAADPDFLAPAMNIACSFVRQERLSEAMVAVRALLKRAFTPWNDEILTAADLGALKVGTPGKDLRAALEEGRRQWAEGLERDVLFIARTRAPLTLPRDAHATAGTFVLGPRQEIFAWSPRTRRYRQLTTEQGRVLALGRSPDGRRLAYATAEKVVLAPGAVPELRGLMIKEMDLGTLAILAETKVAADVRRLEILGVPNGFAFRIDGPTTRIATYSIKDGHLAPSVPPRTAKSSCTLTGAGAVPLAKPMALSDGCPGAVRDGKSAAARPVPEVQVTGLSAAPVGVSGPFGGGLCGLPLP